MKKIYWIMVALLVTSLALPSCTSRKKLYASEKRVWQLKQDSTTLETELARTRRMVSGLQEDSSMLQSEIMSVEQRLRMLAASSNTTIAEQAKRLEDLQNLIQNQKNAMNNLRRTVSDALIKYKSDDLSVYIKDGNVYVSLQEKLLFKSGSAEVDPKGKEALKSLAEVLKNTPDISVMIEGHTDTVPIKTAKFQDNWALSVGRATSIVRILTGDYGVNPTTVTAAGKGSHYPVATNATEEGRAANRRTEIILSPDLNPLFDLMGED